MKYILPNFIIVGAAKSGTTSLYAYLTKHPDIYIPSNKECRFFSQMPTNFNGPGDERVNESIVRRIEEYGVLFSSVKDEKAIGDVSPDYLYYYGSSIEKILEILGDVKIIIILRNPVERAYSQYSHFFRDERETLSFEGALESEDSRKKANWEWAWFYKDVGFYYNQVKAYYDNFSQVRCYLYDDLRNDVLAVTQDIYKFLDVDSSFVPDNLKQKYNVSGMPKNKWLHGFLNKPNLLRSVLKPVVNAVLPKAKRQEMKSIIIAKNLKKTQMLTETREYLKNIYREDVLKLQDLIDRDLSQWIN